MALLSSFWASFLDHFEKDNQKTPVVFSALKQLRPVGLTEDLLTLGCDNPGLKIYLEKKIGLIESALSSFQKKKLKVALIVKQHKEKKAAAPLLSFQPSLEDVFVKAGLHQKYRFENFAVSSSNQVAFAASQAVAKNPGTAYNPLFLYGGVGVGKTHLAQAAARQILEAGVENGVYFCPGDQFTNELIESIRERGTARFRKKYRYLKVLVVDDIQFIAGKETVQEEFFHTFNSVVSAGGQIILTSDRPPSEIKSLESRLRSRFSGGLLVDIQAPDFELKTAILLIKAKEKAIEIDIGAARAIAEQVTDVRGLEGALLSIYAKTLGKKERIDLSDVDLFFQEKTSKKAKKITPHETIRAVCSYYNIKQAAIKNPSRAENVAFPRQIIMYLLRHELGLKYEEIAYLLNRKDHTTIMHGVDKISGLMIKNPVLKEEVARIVSSLKPST